jgi:glycosyltransferase involved in cell wall biosynthesis
MNEPASPSVVDFVMPVYNEGENITLAIEELHRNLTLPSRVLVVFDRDEDNTLPVLRELVLRFPDVIPTKNTLGPGVPNAVRAGIAAATAEVVIVTMADLSDDPAIVPRMVSLIRDEGYDIVCASRYMRGGRQLGGPRVKGLLSRTAGLSLHLLAGLPTHDVTNAFRAYRRSVLEEFPIESRGGFAYSLELLAKAHAAGWRITEVPSTWRDRAAGQSRFRLGLWLPHYLRWYVHALTHRPCKIRRSGAPGLPAHHEGLPGEDEYEGHHGYPISRECRGDERYHDVRD